MENEKKTEAPGGVAGAAHGSASSVRFLLQGKRKEKPTRWDTIGSWPDEAAARMDEAGYRVWQGENTITGWLDYRVVRETTTQEVMPNNALSQTPENEAQEKP